VEYATIDDDSEPGHTTKTGQFSDYFDPALLEQGTLSRKGKRTLDRTDFKLFYALLLQQLAGYMALEMAGIDTAELGSTHYEEDRRLALSALRSREPSRAEERYEKISKIARKLLQKRWYDVELIVTYLLREGTIRFKPDSGRGRIELL
jgi:hypothetical protein